MHTQRHTCTHTQMYTCTHVQAHTHTHACTHTHTHTRTHTHTHTHTHTYTHYISARKLISLITNSLFVLLVHLQTINDHKIIHIYFYELDKKQYHQLLLDYNMTACCDDILPIILAHYKYNNSLSMYDIHTGLLTLLKIVHLLYRQRGTISSN